MIESEFDDFTFERRETVRRLQREDTHTLCATRCVPGMLNSVRAFAAFIGWAPDTAMSEDLRLFQPHQTQIGMQPLSSNSAVGEQR